jgi:hypothetical protein
MNQAIYNHKKKVRNKLCERQSNVWRQLKNHSIEARKLFSIPKEMRLKLEELQSEYDSVTTQIESIEMELLTFEISR